MIKQHENVVLSPFRLFLEDSKVMYLNNGNVQTCHIWMISLRQKLSDDVVRTLSSFSEQFEPRNPWRYKVGIKFNLLNSCSAI